MSGFVPCILGFCLFSRSIPVVNSIYFLREGAFFWWCGAFHFGSVGVDCHPVHNLWTGFFPEGWDGKRAGQGVIWGTAGLSGEFQYPLKGERERS